MSATIEQAGGRQRVIGGSELLRSAALRATWSAFWRSRLLIWAVGGLAFVLLGAFANIRDLADPQRVTSTLGAVGNVLAAPAVRWDSIWYLHLAQHGYGSLQDTGFFPLYPLLIKAVSWPLGSPEIAGVLISVIASVVGLMLVYRLTELELGSVPAKATVTLLAFAPFSFYLTAVYTEGLFLALTAGTFYAARRGRWGLAGTLGGLAAMSRVTGALLIAPVVLLFLYGPRDDARPKPREHEASGWLARLRPRYALTPRILFSLLIPAGLALFCGYTALRGWGLTATFRAQHIYWLHQFKGPVTAIWDGIVAAWQSLSALVSGNTSDIYRTPALVSLGVLTVSVVALVGVFRRLPLAYGVYVLLGLLVPLSSPTAGEPLVGLARYASMMFPLFMWAGAWITGRRIKPLLMGASIVFLLGFTIQFATWQIVGTIPPFNPHWITVSKAQSLGQIAGAAHR